MRTVEVYTVAMYNWRKVKELDVELYDITVKSGDLTFAPTRDMVRRFKNGDLSEEDYTTEYLTLMRQSYVLRNKQWRKFLEKDKVAIACYCGAGKFCHRLILVRLLIKVGKRLGINVVYKGEVDGSQHS